MSKLTGPAPSAGEGASDGSANRTSESMRESGDGAEKRAVDTEDSKTAAHQLPGASSITTTKLRVLNMCCAADGTLVEDALRPLDGVVAISVNVVGRVAYVRHVPRTVSSAELVGVLNALHLGVGVVESGAGGDEAQGSAWPRSLALFAVYLLVQTALVVAAVTGFFLGMPWFKWLAVTEALLGSAPLLQKSLVSVRTCRLDINLLILIAVGGSIALQQWIEAAIVVYVFSVAQGLESACMFKVQRTLSGLILKPPQKALLAETGQFVRADDVAIGTVLAVRPGDLIPLDGQVVKGRASVDESSISGEAAPVEKTVGAHVWSGTVNQDGYLEVKTTADSATSTIARVTRVVEEAHASSTQTEVAITRFVKFYTPVVVAAAVLTAVIPGLLAAGGVEPYRGHASVWAGRAILLLVMACPCALVMATPIAMVSGITASARRGALVKGTAHLETLARLHTLAFDKTGTLTEGQFVVTGVACPPGVDEFETLRVAAAVESNTSHHPLAAAIVRKFRGGCVAEAASEQTPALPAVSGFKLHEGRGISGAVDGNRVQIGNYEFAREAGVLLSQSMDARFKAWSQQGSTVVFVCVEGTLAMMMALADSIRPSSVRALRLLGRLGVEATMITGDRALTARGVATKLGVSEYASQMKPNEKLAWIQARQQSGITPGSKAPLRCPAVFCWESCSQESSERIVGMVGDGINDGPALAAANVGLAMGAGGAALALESADVALMSNDLTTIPELVLLGRFCRTVVRQNIILAVTLKVLVVCLAFAGLAKLWMAVVADMLALLCVIVNGLRPLWWKSRDPNEGVRFAKDSFSYMRVPRDDEDCMD